MTGRRSLPVLMWLGVMAAPVGWYLQHIIGQAIGQAHCSVANGGWSISVTGWQIGLMAVCGTAIVVSEIAAIVVFRATRDAHYEDAPPAGRIQMFAIAAMCTNFLFLVMLLLDGTASILDVSCRNS